MVLPIGIAVIDVAYCIDVFQIIPSGQLAQLAIMGVTKITDILYYIN